MDRAIVGLRWLLVAALGACGFWVAVGVTLALYSGAFALCPKEEIVSGMCDAPWFDAAERAAILSGPAVGAAWTVALPAWVAPRRRARVAWLMFALGAAFTVGIVLEPYARRPERGLMAPLAMLGAPAFSALLVGAGVAVLVSRRAARARSG